MKDMNDYNPGNNSFEYLTEAVESGNPKAAKLIKDQLNNSENTSEMRYLEGLLLLLGEKPGELEDPPDQEIDPEEYWEEY